MARTRKNQTKVCTVTGLETNVNNFYANQTHVKAVDNYDVIAALLKNSCNACLIN